MSDHETHNVFDKSALSLESDEYLYEAVVGQVVDLDAVGEIRTDDQSDRESDVPLVGQLTAILQRYADSQSMGRVVQSTSFIFDESQNLEHPLDIALVSYDRLPADKPIPQEQP